MSVMTFDLIHGFWLGSWKIEPLRGAISGPHGETCHLEPKVMDVLVCLAGQANELVTRNQLLDAVWSRHVAADELLTRAISELRRALHDDRDKPRYIETVPKRGYRLIGQIRLSDSTKPEKYQARSMSITQLKEHKLAFVIVTTLAFALVYFAYEFNPPEFNPPEYSIAVLPFDNLSSEPEQEYFVAGMHEALIAELARLSDLNVISKTSMLHYRETTLTVPEIARELNVAMIVEGSVFKSDDQIRIQFQLIGSQPERHLLTQTYDRELSGVLKLQAEVAQDIAEKIKVNLTPQERSRLADVRTIDSEAYRSWLKGNFFLTKLNEESFRRALMFYQEAIDRDPDYAPAYAGLARAYMLLGSWHASEAPHDVIRLAKKAAEQALVLDRAEASAYFVLGSIRSLFEWDWAGAERAFKHGISLNPNETHGRIEYANFLTAMGRFDESIEIGKRTLELDPLSASACAELGFAFWFAGRDDEALENYRRGLEIDPDSLQLHVVLSGFYLKRHDFDKTLTHLAQLERFRQAWSPADMGLIGRTYALAGRETEARTLLSQLLERRTREFIPASALAHIYFGLGEHEEALRWFEVAYEEHNVSLIWLKEMWVFDRLRSNPRFQAILDRMDFPEP